LRRGGVVLDRFIECWDGLDLAYPVKTYTRYM